MLVSSRSMAEYRRMFALTEADLTGRILDCPGGAASLTAEVNAAGGDTTACDPVYALAGAEELRAHAEAEVDRANRYVRDHPHEYRWSFFTDADHHRRHRHGAVTRFAADLAAHPARYVPATLPELPFPDGRFDLVLSSHLLFSWADRLDLDFHRAAMLELLRVSREEVRVFPLLSLGSVDRGLLERLPAELHADGVASRVVDVAYEFQAGCHQMMVCSRD
jgi:hypothetical protein